MNRKNHASDQNEHKRVRKKKMQKEKKYSEKHGNNKQKLCK